MKKPLLLLIMSGLGFLCLQSQTLEASYENNFSDEMTYIFENLDFSEVTTNLLLDRGMPFIKVDSFDGVQLREYNKLNITRFGLLYATIFGAALDTSALLPHPERYMRAKDSLELSDAIPLSVFHLDYHRFKKNAVDLNLIFVQDSQLHDTPNRPQSPYLMKKVFAVTPVLAATDTLDVTFSLPDSLLFTNTTGISLFEIDLDDGNGYQVLGFNQSITANYSEEGEKELLFRATLADSTIYLGHAKFTARGTGINYNFQNGLNKDYGLSPDTIISFDATADHAYGEIQIGFACKDQGLLRPLLYVQGYFPQIDIGDKEPQSYEFLLETERYGQLIPGGSDRVQDVFELEGYDIIYLQLSFPGDHADRNAEIVKKAVRKLRDMATANGSHEKTVVIGASMGGLLSKYALLEMEQDGENHNVKTLITLDSPFQGANIPVGAQFMVKHLLGTQVNFLAGTVNTNVLALGSFIDIISETSSATHTGFVREALYYNVFENNTSSGSLINPEHTSFYTYFSSLGELQDCDFVAISNGSSQGQRQTFFPGSRLLEIKGSTDDILDLVTIDSVFGVPVNINLEGLPADILQVLGILVGTGVTFDLKVYALPDNPSSYETVYKGRVTAFVFGLLAVSASKFEGKVKGTIPYDSAPGGTLGIAQSAVPGFVTVDHAAFCFVPTVSSLDIPAPANQDLFIPITSPNQTPADRYDASTDASIGFLFNQHHASLNSSNIPFLMAELASGDELQNLPLNANDELVLDNRTYNYGDAEGHFDPAVPTIRHTPHQLKDTLWVEGSGILWVNRDGRISFTDKVNANNTTGTHFDLFIQGKDGCELGGVELHIENGGKMRIGDIAVGNTSSVYVMKDAKVFVQGGGELVMERSSEYIVEGSAETEIGPGGLFQAHGDAATYIRSGGVFRVKDGGTLRLVDESKLLVEVGGKLILEDGAIVQLWDDSQPDGLANIHVQGELVVEGDINFSGRGFFQFDYGNLLTLTNGFELTGSGQGTRFIRLNQIAELKTGGHLVRLSDGKVEYEPGSSISLGIQGSAIFSDVDFVDLNMPSEAFALQAIKTPAMISVTGCKFEGLESGINADNIQGQVIVGNHSRFLRVTNSEFLGCGYGITVSNTPVVEVVGSSFLATSDESLYGIYLKDVGNALCKDQQPFRLRQYGYWRCMAARCTRLQYGRRFGQWQCTWHQCSGWTEQY